MLQHTMTLCRKYYIRLAFVGIDASTPSHGDINGIESVLYPNHRTESFSRKEKANGRDKRFAFNDLGPRLDASAANDLRLVNSKQMSTKFIPETRYLLAPS